MLNWWKMLLFSFLHSFFCSKGVGTSFLTFDAQEGGADFVVSFGERKIVFEVGHRREGFSAGEADSEASATSV